MNKIIKQSTTRYKHVTIIVKVVLVVEVNFFYMTPKFLIEGEYILYYIKIICGMCGVVLWYVTCLKFYIQVAVISWLHVVICSN